jgi:hypothetical protein
MVFVIPGELIGAWEAARERAIREGLELRPTTPEAVHNGMVLEVLIADFLASGDERHRPTPIRKVETTLL